MDYFDKRMALDVIEDTLEDLDSPHSCGMATGLCGAFYMCGLISAEEWKAFLKRIPAEAYKTGINGIFEINASETKIRGRVLN